MQHRLTSRDYFKSEGEPYYGVITHHFYTNNIEQAT